MAEGFPDVSKKLLMDAATEIGKVIERETKERAEAGLRRPSREPQKPQKPHKGKIHNWYRWFIGTEGDYVIAGLSEGHPSFAGYQLHTSKVVSENGREIETLNSRYTLVGEEVVR
jgi:hypothetical protein